MSRVKQLQDLGSGSWDARVGQTDVDVVRAVPGDGLVRADRVVVDAVALRVLDQIQHVVDLRQRPLSEPSGFGQGELDRGDGGCRFAVGETCQPRSYFDQ
jgi:hypothetical protein